MYVFAHDPQLISTIIIYTVFCFPVCRQNLCGITKSSYLAVFLSMLQLSTSCHNKTILGQLQEVLIGCHQALQSRHFLKLFDKDVAIMQLQLLLWCLSNQNKIGELEIVVENTKLEPSGLLREYMQDIYPLSLRTFCLEFINTTSKRFDDDIINCHVLTSMHSETDPDYLIQVCTWLALLK